MIDKSPQEELDWNNLSNPVPLGFIDPEFPPHPPEAEVAPGARSEILPREESEALAEEYDVQPGTFPAEPAREDAEGKPDNPATLEMAAPGLDPLADDFSRIRAKMDAEAEAEKLAKLEAEREESSQRERLEQWMANARARLLKADADLTGPSARVRIHKDHSPSLYRLAEMQKTIITGGEATLSQSPNGTFIADAKGEPPAAPPDPMATICVSAEQFLTLEAPAQPTVREQALARQAAQQATAQHVSHLQTAARLAKEEEEAKVQSTKSDQPYPSGEIQMDQIPAPMTREQALTRKVAQLRKVAEDLDAAAPQNMGDDPQERTALHFAIAAVVIIAIGVLGLGLFAATQAGLFDGLETRVPFLRPKMSVQQRLNPPPESAPAAPAVTVSPVSATPADPVRNPTVTVPVLAAPSAASTPSPPAAIPVLAKTSPVKPAAGPAAARPVASKPNAAVQSRAAAQAKARKTAAVAPAPAPAASEDGGEIPSYARAKPKVSNLGEIILRASVQAAANIDADNLQAMYNRYALGFPGLSGEVVIGLTVDPGGRVLEGSIISSTTGVEAFDQELLRKVLDWRLRAFPESRPKFITVPFLFPLQGR